MLKNLLAPLIDIIEIKKHYMSKNTFANFHMYSICRGE